MAFKRVQKDPSAVLDYVMDFAAKTNNSSGATSDYLRVDEFESLVSATVTSSNPAQLEVLTSDLLYNNTVVVFWLSGGTVGLEYLVTVHIVTSAGREDDRTLRVQIVEK